MHPGARRPRVVYVGLASYLEPGLSLVRALSGSVDLVYLFWLAEESWGTTLLDRLRFPIEPGVHDGEELLPHLLPRWCEPYWRACCKTYVVAFPVKRVTNPRNMITSKRTFRFIRDLRPDVVHLEDPGGLRMVYGSGSLGSSAMVLEVHDPQPHPKTKTWRDWVYRRALFPHVDGFVLHNRSQVTNFCKEFGIAEHRVDSIPLGAYEILTKPTTSNAQPDPARPTVLFFGNLSYYKGVGVLLRSVKALVDRVPDVRVVVAVRNPLGLPKPAGLSAAVEWHSSAHFSPDEAAEFYARSHVVVLPYTSATQSGVLLAAYAFGKPVVASRVGGLPEYIRDGETGLLVEPESPDQLASALARLLLDKRLYARMARAVAETASGELSWASLADEYVAAYERAIHRKALG